MTTTISGDTGVSQCQPNSVSQDDLQSGVVGKGPAFSAVQSSVQGLTNTPVLVNFQTELLDSHNAFASSRFTAPVAGWYQVNARVQVDLATTGLTTRLNKNGALTRAGTYLEATSLAYPASVLSELIYLNATDYIEVFANSVTNRSTSPSAAPYYSCTFSGFLVRAE